MFGASSLGAAGPVAVIRWLRTDARDVVGVEPIGPSRRPNEDEVTPGSRSTTADGSTRRPGVLTDGLLRWRRRVLHRRIVALIRRQLLLALGLGALLELIALVAGAPDRAVWLIAPAIVALCGVLAGLWQPIAVTDVALLLDRELALAECLGTAVELEPLPGSEPQPFGRTGWTRLSAIVVEEAGATVSRSLDGARATLKPATAEWGSMLGLAAVLALLVALPSSALGARPSSLLARAGTAGAGRHARASTGTIVKRRQARAATASRRHPTTAARGVTHRARSPASAVPAGVASALTKGTPKCEEYRIPAFVIRLCGSPSDQNGSPAAPGDSQGASGTVVANRDAPYGPPSAGVTAAGAASGGHAAHGASPRVGRIGGGARKSSSTTQQGTASAHSPSVASGAAKSSSAQGTLSGGHAPPGGEAAGHGRGSTAEAYQPDTARISTSSSGLPIQAGYVSGGGSHAGARPPSGGAGPLSTGSGPERGGRVSSSGAPPSLSFPYVAPTPSLATELNRVLLLSYFSPASWLQSTSW